MTMPMNIWWLTLTAIFSLWICFVHGGQTIMYASGCSVDLCTLKDSDNNSNSGNSNSNVTCPNLPLCYQFDTSTNISICAPQVVCSLFDPCNSSRRCTTNTTVCVVNSCCPSPICVPWSLTSSCSMYTTNNTRNSWSSTICSNATWEGNSTVVITNYVNGNWASLGDFFVDTYNNVYVIDTSGYRILKYALNNPSVYSVVAVTNASLAYQGQNLYVDSNGTIYTSESWYDSSNMTYYYRIVKYSPNGGMSSVIYGPKTCGTNVNQICGSGGLFVDRTGSIYYSDSINHRVLKITPFASSATVVAGTSGTSGSQSNQLYSPVGLNVDRNGDLYIADQNNYRVMKYASGSSTGSTLFTLQSFRSPGGLNVDNAGSVYVATYNGIFKWIPASNNVIQVTPQVYMGSNRIRFDTFGNIYVNGYMGNNIVRYNITANSC